MNTDISYFELPTRQLQHESSTVAQRAQTKIYRSAVSQRSYQLVVDHSGADMTDLPTSYINMRKGHATLPHMTTITSEDEAETEAQQEEEESPRRLSLTSTISHDLTDEEEEDDYSDEDEVTTPDSESQSSSSLPARILGQDFYYESNQADHVAKWIHPPTPMFENKMTTTKRGQESAAAMSELVEQTKIHEHDHLHFSYHIKSPFTASANADSLKQQEHVSELRSAPAAFDYNKLIERMKVKMETFRQDRERKSLRTSPFPQAVAT